MEETTDKTTYKTVDEFFSKYPPPDYAYLIHIQKQVPEFHVMAAKPPGHFVQPVSCTNSSTE